MLITFSSCFYIIKSKFSPETYITWMNNFISIVNNFNLVIYTDENSIKNIDTKNNPNIKIIIKPFEKFYNYKYKTHWEKNHEKNSSLNQISCWELNMLWCEKINFVKETIENKYFDTDFYGWCDIGYFRNRPNNDDNIIRNTVDTNTNELTNWPNDMFINNIDKNKIVYGLINNNGEYLKILNYIITTKNKDGLPCIPIPPDQLSISGGFFMLYKNMINWFFDTFDLRIKTYFENDYLVRDDQMILVDIIFNNLNKFSLYVEHKPPYDVWFLFQRKLK